MKQKVEVMEGPFSAALVEDTEGVIYREIKTVRVKPDGMLAEYVTRREYRSDGDYNDTQTIRPLVKVSGE
jgi:hypothetical protein|tara:strand:+ start:2613 stop:2822 length:210 start_codon:yes stop_codon:yes gene_type:complete